MKIHMFYKLQRANTMVDTSYLYAYTKDPELAKQFKEERSDYYFFYKVVSMTKEEFKLLEKTQGNLRLLQASLYTRGADGQKDRIQILCTAMEEQDVIVSEDQVWTPMQGRFFDTYGFTKKAKSVLNDILYPFFSKFYESEYLSFEDPYRPPYYSSYGPVHEFIQEEGMPKITYDQFEIFLSLFGHTFKELEDREEPD